MYTTQQYGGRFEAAPEANRRAYSISTNAPAFAINTPESLATMNFNYASRLFMLAINDHIGMGLLHSQMFVVCIEYAYVLLTLLLLLLLQQRDSLQLRVT